MDEPAERLREVYITSGNSAPRRVPPRTVSRATLEVAGERTAHVALVRDHLFLDSHRMAVQKS